MFTVNYDGINETDNAMNTTKRTATATAKRGTRTTASAGTVANTFDDAVRIARTVTPATFDAIIGSTVKPGSAHALPLPVHGARNVSRYDGRRIMAVQNDIMERNAAEWKMDDVSVLALMRLCFPVASGRIFAGSLRDAIGIVNGIRRELRTSGHGRPGGPVDVPAFNPARWDGLDVRVRTRAAVPVVPVVPVAPTTAIGKRGARVTAVPAPGVPGGRLVKSAKR